MSRVPSQGKWQWCVFMATEKVFYEEVDFKRDQKVEESVGGAVRGGRCGEGKSDREGWLRPGRMSH